MLGDWDVSIRRTCRVLDVDTSTYHYKSRGARHAPRHTRTRRSARPACGVPKNTLPDFGSISMISTGKTPKSEAAFGRCFCYEIESYREARASMLPFDYLVCWRAD
jgi:hypothetical protein